MTSDESSQPESEWSSGLSLPQLCGQLLIVGFSGTELPGDLERDLSAGLRGGVILFRRNLPTLEATWKLCCQVVRTCQPRLAPLIGIDEEGGRVTRLPSPARKLPPMRRLGVHGDSSLIERAAAAVGKGLSALGFNMDFAPVLDVDSNPANPVIGDRSFSNESRAVAHCGLAFARGLNKSGLLACGKHFPGHGDTHVDSHLELPFVKRPRDELERRELLPFREAAAQGLDAMMTAHVVYDALDPRHPATLSQKILTDLLRTAWAYPGLIVSDDLEMGALVNNGNSLEENAVAAIRAGCDQLLVCHSTERASQVLDALIDEADADPAFCQRVHESAERSLAARLRCPPRPESQFAAVEHVMLGAETRQLFDEVEQLVTSPQ